MSKVINKKLKNMKKLKIMWIALFFILLPGILAAKTVDLPITIEYPLIKSFVISNFFNGTQKEKILLSDQKGCRKIVISDPDFSEENSFLRFKIKVSVKAGIYLKNDCYLPLQWDGYVILFQNLEIDPSDWALSFQTHNSIVLNKNHEPEKVTGVVWNLIKGYVHSYVDAMTIDLSPPINEVKSFLLDLFPETEKDKARLMVESMRPGNIDILKNAVRVGIIADAASVDDRSRVSVEEQLSETELDAFITSWETMDAFFIYMITRLTHDSLNREEKDLIFELILDTRHRFVNELASSVHEIDFVRDQFIKVWDSLGIILKRYFSKNSDITPMGYLALFSSLDALKVLDSIGPSIGIEISHNGLLRLVRLIANKKAPQLFYSDEIDKNLRQIMGFDPIEQGSSISNMDQFLSRLWKLRFVSLASIASAADPVKINDLELTKWIAPKTNVSGYVNSVRRVLKEASDKSISKGKLDSEYHDLFYLIVDSVAWQESCFRQFKEKKGKIEYLRSYNNTSVGAMQINERVWRGIYDQEKLRWNIHYNADVGCEIIDLYLNRYILKKMKKGSYLPLRDKDNIARILYALYNGGPSQFSKFLKRFSKGDFYKSDTLFHEKYLWVKNRQWDKARICLVGR